MFISHKDKKPWYQFYKCLNCEPGGCCTCYSRLRQLSLIGEIDYIFVVNKLFHTPPEN
jgi:hypothetical protein